MSCWPNEIKPTCRKWILMGRGVMLCLTKCDRNCVIEWERLGRTDRNTRWLLSMRKVFPWIFRFSISGSVSCSEFSCSCSASVCSGRSLAIIFLVFCLKDFSECFLVSNTVRVNTKNLVAFSLKYLNHSLLLSDTKRDKRPALVKSNSSVSKWRETAVILRASDK